MLEAATTLATGQNSPLALAVDATSVYWVNGGEESQPGGSVVKVPLAGGTPATLAMEQLLPQGIAVDETSVYWTTTAGA